MCVSRTFKLIIICAFCVCVAKCRGKRYLFPPQLHSPCPDIFQYRYDNGMLYGNIQIQCPNDIGIQLNVELSVGNSVEGYNGNVELAYSKTKVVEDILHRRPITYNLLFPRWSGIPPRVTKIFVNENLICSGPKIPRELVHVLTTVNLRHLLKLSMDPELASTLDQDFSPSDYHITRLDDSFQPLPSSKTSEFNFRPERDQVGQARINFNPQPPKDPSRIYPGNPFLNKLATTYPSTQTEEKPRQVPVTQDGPIVTFIRERPGGGSLEVSKTLAEDIELELPSSTESGKSFAGNPFLGKWLASALDSNEQTNRDPPVASVREPRPPPPPAPTPRPQTTTAPRFQTVRPSLQPKDSTGPKRVQPIEFPDADSEVDDTPKVESNLVKSPFADICGRSVVTNDLVVHGEPVARGAFPWLVAMFLLKNLGPEFRCSGSLISHKHIVTAAHCLKNGTKTLRPEDILLVLGKLNLKNWSREVGLQIGAETLEIHPSYQPLSADADIAVVTLSQTVEFTKFVRPICLWIDNTRSDDIVGELGTVVGWGKDEYGDFMTEVPKKAVMPVVSQEDCIRSKYSFKEITSERTFCAGFRNGTGPCNGDSGGGFVIQKNDRYTLRGIVSTSLLDQERKTCDLQNYVVFTDTSKFIDWLLLRIK